MRKPDHKPLISIIIPCYNAEAWVAETIDAALAQTYPSIEVIVVDDGSTDDSLSVIRSLGDKITCLTGANRGGCHARNRGIDASKGDFLLFLDADDLISPDLIEGMVEGLLGTDKTIAASSWAYLYLEGNHWTPEIEGYALNRPPPQGDYLMGLLTDWWIASHALLHPRSLVLAVGGWDETLSAGQDSDFLFRLLLAGASICNVDRGCAYYRQFGTDRITVGTSKTVQAIRSRVRCFDKLEAALKARGLLDKYALALGRVLMNMAGQSFEGDRDLSRACARRGFGLAGYKAYTGTLANRLACILIGFERKQLLSRFLARHGVTFKRTPAR